MPNCQNLELMQAGCRINFPGGHEWGWVGVAGLTENLAELELMYYRTMVNFGIPPMLRI